MSKLKQVTITLNAGSRESYAFRGNYLRLVTSLAGVNIKTENDDDFNIQNGNDVVFEDTDFYRIELTSLSGLTEAITIMVGENVKFSAPTVSGAVSILGTPTVIVGNAQSAARDYSNGYYVTLGANAAALTAVTLIAPSENINGIEILKLNVSAYLNSPRQRGAVIAAAAAPVNLNAGQEFLAQLNGLVFQCTLAEVENVKVNAGKGIYFISSDLTDSLYFSAHALIKKL